MKVKSGMRAETPLKRKREKTNFIFNVFEREVQEEKTEERKQGKLCCCRTHGGF